jgi:hypothetical protein
MKNAHLRRTSMYASLLVISGALHLGVFDQPAWQVLFSNLLEGQVNFLSALDISAVAIKLNNQILLGCYCLWFPAVEYEGFPAFYLKVRLLPFQIVLFHKHTET